jgi:hypothetical protein
MEPAMLAFEVLEQVWPLLDEERAIPGIVPRQSTMVFMNLSGCSM